MPATTDVASTVILVDEQDTAIGTAEKLVAHQQGLLHRAFSIFIFRPSPYREKPGLQLLLQQRAEVKYHSPGLWTNTCCSHPHPGEELILAAHRRLQEEFNLNIELQHVGQFHYLAHLNNGLIENELDHVFVGQYQNQEIAPNPAEIQNYRWVNVPDLQEEIRQKPELFTPWLEQALIIASQGTLSRSVHIQLNYKPGTSHTD